MRSVDFLQKYSAVVVVTKAIIFTFLCEWRMLLPPTLLRRSALASQQAQIANHPGSSSRDC